MMKSLYKRYLKLLGIRSMPEGLDGLKEMIQNHLFFVPFENVSKLLLFDREKKGRPLSLTEFLDGIEYHDLGGTCHSSNPYLQQLLSFLGFETVLLGADMDSPNVHTCLRTKINSNRYHIDVGYAAPFKEPIPLDRIPVMINHGSYTYRFQNDSESHRYEIEVLRGDQKIHGYIVNEDPRPIEFFNETIRKSFEPGKTFMSCIRITRVFRDKTIELKNNKLNFYWGKNHHTMILKNMAQVESAVKNELQMPHCPIQKAVAILERITRTSFFAGGEAYPEDY